MKEKLTKFLMDSIGSQLPMRERFFNICTLGGTAGALLATIAPLISGVYSNVGIVIGVFTSLFFLALFILNYFFKKCDLFIIIGIVGLNFVIYPLLYFTMGGVEGGMILYFIMGIVFTLLLLDLKEALIIFPLEIVGYSLVFYLGDVHPELFSAVYPTPRQIVLDNGFDFFIVSLTTFFVIKILYNAYETQADKANKLVQELERLSTTDPLTKLYNRRFLMQAIETEIIKSKRENYTISVIMFDIDKFKSVNDTYGHVIGDEVLTSFANVLSSHMREYDTVARYGGEEFMILLPKANEEIAFMRAEEIRRSVEASELCSSTHIPITVSGGVAVYEEATMSTVEDLTSVADTYLYESKESGRNRITWKGNSHGLQK